MTRLTSDKIPVSFNFCTTTKCGKLVRNIKDALAAVKEFEFFPVVTICDQSSENQLAVKTLIYDTMKVNREDYVIIEK